MGTTRSTRSKQSKHFRIHRSHEWLTYDKINNKRMAIPYCILCGLDATSQKSLMLLLLPCGSDGHEDIKLPAFPHHENLDDLFNPQSSESILTMI